MGAYDPQVPAKRPGKSPSDAPRYRVLVHHRYLDAWNQLVTRVGLQQAQQFWDHVAQDPGNKTGIASTSILKGSAGRPKERGFSRTYHYELTSMARINYQFCDSYQTSEDGDPHREVFILTIDYTSH
ncbi:MAG: hypothetical protein U0N15_02260 [Bifidobacterium choerinum]